MKRYSIKAILALGAMVFTPAVVLAQTPGAGLLGTNHDFASATGNQIPNTAGGVGLCTYCHTPHKALSTRLLWNHTLSANTFSWDVASTTAGTTFPTVVGNTYKGPSAKCLSCHDGSVAVGDVAWYKEQAWPTPSNLVNYATTASPTLPSSGAVMATFKMGDLDGTGGSTNQFLIGPGGNMAGNHPVMMPYPFNQTGSTYNTSTSGARLVLTEWQADPTLNQTSAHIRLFTDNTGTGDIVAGPTATKTGIECSSCHDPHNKAAVDGWFLRGKVQGSTQADGYICLQCHIK